MHLIVRKVLFISLSFARRRRLIPAMEGGTSSSLETVPFVSTPYTQTPLSPFLPLFPGRPMRPLGPVKPLCVFKSISKFGAKFL